MTSTCPLVLRISIHALREEGDMLADVADGRADQNFYPRPPRGGRQGTAQDRQRLGEFLSTPSARRATSVRPLGCRCSDNFYPRPPRGGRPLGRGADLHRRDISIHALREEGDGRRPYSLRAGTHFYPRPPRGGRQDAERLTKDMEEFLSTPSARRATIIGAVSVEVVSISIHALREEGD